MDAVDLAYAGLARQADLLGAGEISSRELTQLYLDRIAAHDPHLNAFRVVFAERALAEAAQADARRGAGGERPLLGLPLAIKDDADMAGEITAFGTNAFGAPAREDAEVVRRLRAAGAVFIGKTHVPELTIHGFTESPTWGATRNPWDLQRTPGGSSGGTAAAVAAGLVGGGLGSDGAGSIRLPAGACGIFGLKPQRGRVPTTPKAEPWRGLSVYGALTRRVADAARFYDAVKDGGPSFVEAAGARPGRLRVAVSLRVPPPIAARVDGEQRAAVERMREVLRSLGHEVFDGDPNYSIRHLPNFSNRYLKGIADDAAAMAHPDRLSRRTRGYARAGQLIPDSLVRKSMQAADADAVEINRIFERADVVVTPLYTRRAARIGEFEGQGFVRTYYFGEVPRVPFCGLWNHTGQPAMAVPAGSTSDGFPLSVQIVGRPDDEATLLSLAAQLEAELDWPAHRPPQFS